MNQIDPPPLPTLLSMGCWLFGGALSTQLGPYIFDVLFVRKVRLLASVGGGLFSGHDQLTYTTFEPTCANTATKVEKDGATFERALENRTREKFRRGTLKTMGSVASNSLKRAASKWGSVASSSPRSFGTVLPIKTNKI